MKKEIDYSAYDMLIWDRVWAKAENDFCEKNKRNDPLDTNIVDEICSATNVSESVVWTNHSGTAGKWQTKTREEFLSYLKYASIEVFIKTLSDEEKEKLIFQNSNKNFDDLLPLKNKNISAPSKHFNIPIRPSYFVGREKKLKEIHKSLTNKYRRGNILLVSGTGGIGKTTLVQEYLNRNNCQRHFNYIIVISVNRDLENAFIVNVANVFKIDLQNVVLQEEKLKAVVQKIKRCEGDNLIVVDNINEYDYEDLLKMKSTFDTTGWKFLITTRPAPDGFEALKVDELDLNEAISLFAYHYVPEQVNRNDTAQLKRFIEVSEEKNDIKLLLEHISRHTLLTELLAKVGKKKGISVNKLLQNLKEQDLKHKELARTITIGPHAENTFRTEQNRSTIHLYLLSIFDTEYLLKSSGNIDTDTENSEKVQMLRFFSVLPTEEIPVEDLKLLWDVHPEDENSFEDRLDELKQIGWLKGKQVINKTEGYFQNLTFEMHHLVQEVIYEKLKPSINNCQPLVRSVTKMLSSKTSSKSFKFENYVKSVIDKLEGLM